MITVTCTREQGRYRAGVFHPAGRKEWPDDQFGPEQIEAIRHDKYLILDQPPHDPGSAQQAALALLRPFLKVPETQAQAALAELLPVSGPVLDRPLDVETGEVKPPSVSRRRTAGGE